MRFNMDFVTLFTTISNNAAMWGVVFLIATALWVLTLPRLQK